MVPIMELWLPIVLATLLCFFAGALLHMAIPVHKNDWRPLPDEDGVMAALKRAGVTPGNFMFPHMDREKAKDPAFQQKLVEGPSGVITIRPNGPITMGPYLIKQFIFHLAVTFVIAYLASRTLDRTAEYLHVFRVVGTASIMAYAAGIIPEAIWYHQPRNYVMGKVVDGLVWGLLTAGSFAGFFPNN